MGHMPDFDMDAVMESAVLGPTISMIDVGGGQKLRTGVWQGDGKKRPILFFNGIGANLEMVAPLGEMMRDRCDVIVFDMPGIGGSPAPRIPYRPSTVGKWANRILDHLGYDKVDVMGISWGGGAAQEYARNYPDQAMSLVLLATSAGMVMVPGQIGAIRRMANPRRYVDPDYMLKNFQTLYGDGLDATSMGHTSRIIAPTKRGYLYQLMAMLGWTSIHFLPYLKQPTLVMSGDRDSIVPLANSRILKAMIPRSDLRIVRGGGHLFAVTRANQVVPTIAHFLDDHADDRIDEFE